MSIPSIASLVLSPDAAGPATNAEAVQASPPVADNADTVQLTDAERVYVLYIQGQRVAQIAVALNLPVAVVDSYLNLSGTAA